MATAPLWGKAGACNRGGLRAFTEQCEGSRPERSTVGASKEVVEYMCGLLSSQTISSFLKCISLYPMCGLLSSQTISTFLKCISLYYEKQSDYSHRNCLSILPTLDYALWRYFVQERPMNPFIKEPRFTEETLQGQSNHFLNRKWCIFRNN